jgi:hypothetical protein
MGYIRPKLLSEDNHISVMDNRGFLDSNGVEQSEKFSALHFK